MSLMQSAAPRRWSRCAALGLLRDDREIRSKRSLGLVAQCWRTASRWMGREAWRSLRREPRCCCIAQPTPLWPDIRRRSPCARSLPQPVEAYVAYAKREFDPKAYYLSNHRGHLMFVRPDERPFITAEMIRRTVVHRHGSLISRGRLGALADAGFSSGGVLDPTRTGTGDRRLGPHPSGLSLRTESTYRSARCPTNLPARPPLSPPRDRGLAAPRHSPSPPRERVSSPPISMRRRFRRSRPTAISTASLDVLNADAIAQAATQCRTDRHPVQLCRPGAPGHSAGCEGSRVDARLRSQRALDVSHDAGVPAGNDRAWWRCHSQHGFGGKQRERPAQPLHLQRDQGGGDRHDEVCGDRLHQAGHPLQLPLSRHGADAKFGRADRGECGAGRIGAGGATGLRRPPAARAPCRAGRDRASSRFTWHPTPRSSSPARPS